MSEPSQYVDRATGELRSDVIHAHGFLDWCHNSRAGWWLTSTLLCRGPVSALYGWWHRRSWTRRKIRPFAEHLRVDLSECVRDVGEFPSFAEFIVRDIDLGRRPVDRRENVCVSPADARVLVLPEVRADREIVIKRAPFALRSLVDDEAAATEYDGGSAAVFRLYLGDYHHFHFPVDCVPGAARSIRGGYFAVTPYARERLVPFYARNHRHVTVLATERCGSVAMVEVGAFTIGSIVQAFVPGVPAAKGVRKGRFELGASIVVLLFPPGAVVFDDDLVAHSAAGHETYVRVGESIGRALA